MYMEVSRSQREVEHKNSGSQLEFLGHDAFPGHAESLFRSGANVAQTDPTIWISAMAAVSKSVAFGITGSTSYINVG